MGDLVVVAVVIAFFSLLSGFVVLCDRIIGPDADLRATPDPQRAPAERP